MVKAGRVQIISMLTVLPNTQIELNIPLTQITFESEELEGKTKTMPVTPDFIMDLDAKDFIDKIDTQLKYALKLFKKVVK